MDLLHTPQGTKEINTLGSMNAFSQRSAVLCSVLLCVFSTDGNLVIEEEYAPMSTKNPMDFDELLKQAQRKLKQKS